MDELVDRVVNAIHGIEDLTEQVAEAIWAADDLAGPNLSYRHRRMAQVAIGLLVRRGEIPRAQIRTDGLHNI